MLKSTKIALTRSGDYSDDEQLILRRPFWFTKCLHGMAPPYLASCASDSSSRLDFVRVISTPIIIIIILHLGHITNWTIQLAIRHNRPTHCATYKDRADRLRQPYSFAVHGPVVWNSLPAELRSPDILDVFRKQLKTSV